MNTLKNGAIMFSIVTEASGGGSTQSFYWKSSETV